MAGTILEFPVLDVASSVLGTRAQGFGRHKRNAGVSL